MKVAAKRVMKEFHDMEAHQFTPEQIERLGFLPKLQDANEVERVADYIHALVCLTYFRHARDQKIPNRRNAKVKLQAIENTTRKLINLLRDFDITDYGTGLIGRNEELPDGIAQLFCRKPLWDDSNTGIADLFGLLVNLQTNAKLLRTNDEYFRSYYHLPKYESVNRDFFSGNMWPSLFKIWELVGNVVVLSDNGKTIQFLRLIHEYAGIDPPTKAALRTARKRWENNSARDADKALPWSDDAIFNFGRNSP
ncbi:hypothetical protein [Methylorubrum extorquens]|uniref:Uncharacterized protein n=1 Tax=Methylorubrum extorquens (strain CM4 / NCIMB 13688) TaxID=440085 RepID=B7KUI6_METC4|nr:hypothetical protein [Methylorubrum extorquens]ACK84215.1 hypothetical protein Mchl_3395 [Methylorubrum extorquens CM4]